MSTKVIGRVSIRVLPDSTRFRSDLKKSLDRIEAQVRVRVNVEPTVSRKSLADARREIENGIDPEIKPDVDATIARARLAALARNRIIELSVRLRKSSVAAVTSALANFSGARSVSDSIQRIGTSLLNLDKSAPKVAALSSSLLTLSAVALSGAANLVTLGGSIAAIGGAGLALPGLFAGFAVGIGTMVAALKDAKTVLADLGPSFSALQDTISARFWEQAAGPVRELTGALLPTLQAKLGQVSTALGGFTAAFAGNLQAALTPAVLGGMMDNLTRSINVAKGSIAPLVASFTTLGTVGSSYLPSLAGWFAKLTQDFNAFVQGAAKDGSLTQWINNGISALQQLGGVVANTGRILGALFNAASAAGGGGLASLNQALGQVASTMSQPVFQGALTTIFTGAAQAVTGLGKALGPIGDMFVALAPTLANVMSMAGQAIGQLLSAVAAAFSSPAFAGGLEAFFTGVLSAVTALSPAIGPLAAAFGTLAGFAGRLLAVLGPVFASVIQALAPVFEGLVAALEPLLPILGETLIAAVQALAPVFMALIPALDPIVQIITALLPIITTLAQLLGAVLPPVIQVLVPIIQVLAAAIAGVVPVVTFLVDSVRQNFTLIQTLITNAINIVKQVIAVVLAAIRGDWKGVWDGIRGIAASVWSSINTVIQGGVNFVKGVITAGLQAVKAIWVSIFNLLPSSVRNAISGVSSALSGMRSMVVGFFSGIGGWLRGAGEALIGGFISGIKAMVGSVGSAISDVLSFAKGFFPHSPAKRGPFSGRGYTTYSGRALASDFAAAISSQESLVARAASGLMSAASLDAVSGGAGFAGAAGASGGINQHFTFQAAPGMSAEAAGKAAAREFMWKAGKR